MIYQSWSTLDSILFQFPLGGVCFTFIIVTGYLSSRIPNIRLILLVLCCFPVIAGCAIIWRSSWTRQAAAPIVGYTLIGFFGPVVSLIISIGMANVAGATKKSCTAAAIFVAYCVGNVGTQASSILFEAFTTDIRVDNRAAIDQNADIEATLSRAMAGAYHLVGENTQMLWETLTSFLAIALSSC